MDRVPNTTLMLLFFFKYVKVTLIFLNDNFVKIFHITYPSGISKPISTLEGT